MPMILRAAHWAKNTEEHARVEWGGSLITDVHAAMLD